MLGHVGDPERARRGGHTGHARQIARVAREHVAVVRAAERPAQTRLPWRDVAAGAVDEHHGLGTVLVLDGIELALYDVVGFVPAHALPLVLAAVGAGALHRVGEAVLVVHDLGHVEAAHAQAPLGHRVLGVALHLHELAVLVGVHQHAAPQVASRPRPRAAARYRVLAFLVAPRLPDIVDIRKRVELDNFSFFIELVFAHGLVLPPSRPGRREAPMPGRITRSRHGCHRGVLGVRAATLFLTMVHQAKRGKISLDAKRMGREGAP